MNFFLSLFPHLWHWGKVLFLAASYVSNEILSIKCLAYFCANVYYFLLQKSIIKRLIVIRHLWIELKSVPFPLQYFTVRKQHWELLLTAQMPILRHLNITFFNSSYIFLSKNTSELYLNLSPSLGSWFFCLPQGLQRLTERQCSVLSSVGQEEVSNLHFFHLLLPAGNIFKYLIF